MALSQQSIVNGSNKYMHCNALMLKRARLCTCCIVRHTLLQFTSLSCGCCSLLEGLFLLEQQRRISFRTQTLPVTLPSRIMYLAWFKNHTKGLQAPQSSLCSAQQLNKLTLGFPRPDFDIFGLAQLLQELVAVRYKTIGMTLFSNTTVACYLQRLVRQIAQSAGLSQVGQLGAYGAHRQTWSGLQSGMMRQRVPIS